MPRSERKKKEIGGSLVPRRGIREGASPESIMAKNPSWCISLCDTLQGGAWSFYKDRLVDDLWTDILPKLRGFEQQTWSDILIDAKKQNHSIPCEELNKAAQKRLEELLIDTDIIYSLRLSGNVRIYGVLIEAVFYILWYDDNHGDNESCVCRSRKKHT